MEYGGYSIAEFLSKQMLAYSVSTLRKMVYQKIVEVNREIVTDPTQKVRTGDTVVVEIPKDHVEEYAMAAPELPILFENQELLVVNKPAGVPVVAERWNEQNVFKDAIFQHLEESGESAEPNIVHRIDKDASGIVLLAKTKPMHRYLNQLFEERKIKKEYLALVAGVPQQQGRIELKIAPASRHDSRQIISEFGKMAITNYQVRESFRDFALLEVNIETGRTHQIRVHLASQGYPLAVDPIYGYRNCLRLSDIKLNYQRKSRTEKALIARLTLHAWRVSLILPNQEPLNVEAPIPDDFELILKMLRKYRGTGGPALETQE